MTREEIIAAVEQLDLALAAIDEVDAALFGQENEALSDDELIAIENLASEAIHLGDYVLNFWALVNSDD